jgi:hypothetical protein
VHIDEANKINILDKIGIAQHNDKVSAEYCADLINKVTNNIMEYHDYVELNEEDVEIINVVNEIIRNYEKIDIYNKKQLYVYIKEYCNHPTRKITSALNKMKIMYTELKKDT